jgi:hypothetical protein
MAGDVHIWAVPAIASLLGAGHDVMSADLNPSPVLTCVLLPDRIRMNFRRDFLECPTACLSNGLPEGPGNVETPFHKPPPPGLGGGFWKKAQFLTSSVYGPRRFLASSLALRFGPASLAAQN